MKVKEFHSFYQLKNMLEKRGLIPMEVTKITLKHNEKENHYVYVFEITVGEYWFTDSPTNFSGSGGAMYRELEKFIEYLKTYPQIVFKEFEMPYEFYWLLKNMFWALWENTVKKEH